MNIYFYYNTTEITVVLKDEQKCVEQYKLGFKCYSVSALHLSRDIRYVSKTFKRLGYRPKEKTIEQIKRSIITKTTIELYCNC